MPDRGKWLIETELKDEGQWWASWDAINRESFESHPLLASRFIRLLCEYFTGGKLFYAQFEGADGSALIQAVLERSGSGQWKVFCPSQAGLGAIVFAKRSETRWLQLREMLAQLPGLSLAVTLPYQDAPYSLVADATGGLVHKRLLGTTMTVIADDFEAYWSARPKVMRDNLRRHMKRPAKDGLAVELRHVREPEQIAQAVERYADLESAGWKGKEGTALARGNAQCRFYTDLLTGFAATGDARVVELYIGERLAASRFLISGPGMYVVLKTTFDEAMRHFSPGHSQLNMLLAELIAETPGKPIEFYTKATKDWLQWATHTRPIESVTVYKNGMISWLAAVRRKKSDAAQPEQPQVESA
jgi:hypothetical protein